MGLSQMLIEVRNLAANVRDRRGSISSLSQEDPLEKAMAIHSSIHAWGITKDRGA